MKQNPNALDDSDLLAMMHDGSWDLMDRWLKEYRVTTPLVKFQLALWWTAARTGNDGIASQIARPLRPNTTYHNTNAYQELVRDAESLYGRHLSETMHDRAWWIAGQVPVE